MFLASSKTCFWLLLPLYWFQPSEWHELCWVKQKRDLEKRKTQRILRILYMFFGQNDNFQCFCCTHCIVYRHSMHLNFLLKCIKTNGTVHCLYTKNGNLWFQMRMCLSAAWRQTTPMFFCSMFSHINISIERTTQYMAAVLLGGRAHLNWIVSAKIVTYVNNRVINKMDEMQYNIMRNSKLHVYYYTGACTLYSVNQQLSVFSILYSTRTWSVDTILLHKELNHFGFFFFSTVIHPELWTENIFLYLWQLNQIVVWFKEWLMYVHDSRKS